MAMKRGSRAAGSSEEPFNGQSGEDENDDEESPLLPELKEKPKPPPPSSLCASLQDGFGLGPFLHTLETNFGYELLVMLFVAQHLMKGFVNEAL
mgnify:CR=1 FL=1